MTPIQFTGDLTIIERATNMRCRAIGDACVVGIHYVERDQWIVEDGGFHVLDNVAYLRWKAEREVEETLYRWAA